MKTVFTMLVCLSCTPCSSYYTIVTFLTCAAPLPNLQIDHVCSDRPGGQGRRWAMLSSQGCEDTGPNATRAMCPRATIFNSEWCGGDVGDCPPAVHIKTACFGQPPSASPCTVQAALRERKQAIRSEMWNERLPQR